LALRLLLMGGDDRELQFRPQSRATGCGLRFGASCCAAPFGQASQPRSQVLGANQGPATELAGLESAGGDFFEELRQSDAGARAASRGESASGATK